MDESGQRLVTLDLKELNGNKLHSNNVNWLEHWANNAYLCHSSNSFNSVQCILLVECVIAFQLLNLFFVILKGNTSIRKENLSKSNAPKQIRLISTSPNPLPSCYVLLILTDTECKCVPELTSKITVS